MPKVEESAGHAHERILGEILREGAVPGEQVGESEGLIDVQAVQAFERASLDPRRLRLGAHPAVHLPDIETHSMGILVAPRANERLAVQNGVGAAGRRVVPGSSLTPLRFRGKSGAISAGAGIALSALPDRLRLSPPRRLRLAARTSRPRYGPGGSEESWWRLPADSRSIPMPGRTNLGTFVCPSPKLAWMSPAWIVQVGRQLNAIVRWLGGTGVLR